MSCITSITYCIPVSPRYDFWHCVCQFCWSSFLNRVELPKDLWAHLLSPLSKSLPCLLLYVCNSHSVRPYVYGPCGYDPCRYPAVPKKQTNKKNHELAADWLQGFRRSAMHCLQLNRLNPLQLHESTWAEMQPGHSDHYNFSLRCPKTVLLRLESLVWTGLKTQLCIASWVFVIVLYLLNMDMQTEDVFERALFI